MFKFLSKILKFLKNVFIMNNVLPPRKDPEDVSFLYELQSGLKDFRLDNGLMPLNYSFALEYFAQENADNNYRFKVIMDNLNPTIIDMHLRMQNIYLKNFTLLCVYSDGDVDTVL